MQNFKFAIVATLLLSFCSQPCWAKESATDGQTLTREALLAKYGAAARERWEDSIKKLEAQDQMQEASAESVLLVGSSSIRLWKTPENDLAPYETIQRGYGGAKFSDLAVYAPRLITPHRFQAAVIFVGNDVSGSPQDRTPAEVEPLVRHVLQVIHQHQPNAQTLLVEVTPTPARYAAWPKIRALNAMLREVSLTTPNCTFVATAEHYLDRNNKPIERLFVADRLHQNQEGYRVWSGLIRRSLDLVLR